MASIDGLPPWQWADYPALKAAQNNKPVSGNETPAVRQTFEADVIDQKDPKYIVQLFRDEFGELMTDNIQFYHEAARRGVDYFEASIFKSIRQKDLRIGGLLLKRRAAIHSEQYAIGVKGWEEGQKYIEEIFDSQKNQLYDFFSSCVEANFQGMKMFEVNYQYRPEGTTIGKIRPIDNSLYLYDFDSLEYSILDTSKKSVHDIRADAIRNLYQDVSSLPKQDIHPLKLIQVFGLDGDDENAFMNGFRHAFAFAYFFKSYNWKDMQIFIERYASPILNISYDSVNEKAKQEAYKIAKQAKAHGISITPKEAMTIAFIESQNKGAVIDVFMTPIEHIDTEMSIRVNGEADTTNKIGKNGSKSAIQVKKEIADYIKLLDLKVILTAGNQLIKNLIDMKFPNPPEYPQLGFISNVSTDEMETLSTVLKNISDSGFEAEAEEVAKKFNYNKLIKKQGFVKPQMQNQNDGETKAGKILNIDSVDLYLDKVRNNITGN